MKNDNGDITIKQAIDDLLKTDIFKNITKRNDSTYAKKLAIWLVRYILLISSMKESLEIDLETVLLNIHGDKLKKIIEITEKSFKKTLEDYDKYNSYT
jgi:hypothetical protein